MTPTIPRGDSKTCFRGEQLQRSDRGEDSLDHS